MTKVAGRLTRMLRGRAPRPAPAPVVADPPVRRCNLCRHDVVLAPLDRAFSDQMYGNGFPYPLSDFETLNAGEYSCPRCGSSDRDRLYVLYLRQYLEEIGERPVELLEFAPSPVLRGWLARKANVRYRSADLYMPEADDRVDITDMPGYPDARFDFVICSHVLEHVEDDAKALAELRRILTPGGRAIIMTPVIDRDEVFDEDPSVTDEAERWRRFAQNDHVRLYSKTVLVSRMEAAGFTVAQLGADHFGAATLMRYGITERSVLYVATS